MGGSDYYLLDCLLREDAARISIAPGAELAAEAWQTGALMAPETVPPVRYRVVPGEEGELPAYVGQPVPLMSDELVEALRAAGVDNLQLFDAVIEEPSTGRIHQRHKAVNVIGRVSCVGAEVVDRGLPSVVIDRERAHDLSFFRLAEQPGRIVLHRRIKERLERQAVGAKIDFQATAAPQEPER